MNCPICDVPLKMTERQGIEIDYCPKCRGVWLDRGELDKIIERSAKLLHDTDEHPAVREVPRSQSAPLPQVGNPEKRKRGKVYDDARHYDDDHLDFDRRDYERGDHDPRYSKRRKRESWLGELFDIFD